MQKALKIFKCFLISLGALFLVLLILSFTDIPYHAYYHLGTADSELKKTPDLIVVLGGSGMPSPDGLMRCYYAAEAAKKFPAAKIIIALPYNENDSLYQLKLMSNELILRQVDSTRIHYEPLGFNTRSQALNIAAVFESDKNSSTLLLITSPEHMYRSVKVFRNVGFKEVGGIPAFEKPVDEEKVKDKEQSKDPRIKNLALRYNMWSYLNYELLVMREYCAISYYTVKGWM